MSLGDNVKRLRRAQGWTQQDLHEKTGLRVAHISEMEQGKSDPKLSTLYKLIQAFGCSPDTLMMDREQIGLDGLLKQTLERASALPPQNKLAILEVVDKYCIACKVAEEYSDPERVGWSEFLQIHEILDPEFAAHFHVKKPEDEDEAKT